MSPSLSWFELSPVRRERSRKAALVACMLVAIACDDKKTEDNPAASASASVAVTPSATPPPAPARPPLLSLDDSAVTVQGDKIDFTGDAKGKLTAALLGNPRVAHEMIELQAIRDAKVARVQIVISAIKAAKAKGVTLKTATRELSTLGQIDIVFDHAPAPACSVVGLVGKDSSIMVWSIGGGTAQRFTRGMAGPDLTLGSAGMRKAAASCDSNFYFVAGDDSVKWGLVFDLALAALTGDAGTMRAVQAVVLTETPVAGRKVADQ